MREKYTRTRELLPIGDERMLAVIGGAKPGESMAGAASRKWDQKRARGDNWFSAGWRAGLAGAKAGLRSGELAQSWENRRGLPTPPRPGPRR
jgi:hypothetical protein